MDLTELFCHVDDFCENNNYHPLKIENCGQPKRGRPRQSRLSISEIMTICIHYHQSGYKNFKTYYLQNVFKNLKGFFSRLVSYNRFVELMSSVAQPLTAFLTSHFGEVTGISYIDSTPIQVCKPKRMDRNKVFKPFAAKAKSTIGWFFGFKLHLIVNEVGELLSVCFTRGNVDDRTPVLSMAKHIFGKLFGDKGYISQELTKKLFNQNVELITSVRKNMKNKFLHVMDKILLRKRSIIETINNQLKNISDIEHSRHRSPKNFVVNLLCGLIAYVTKPKKPRISGLQKQALLAV